MPTCGLCESISFNVVDGLYFCNDCGTQSQDVQEEVAEELDNQNIRLEVKKNKGSKNKQIFDFGKPWFTYEGYQIVIKKQIEFLIKIGVNPKIKDILGQIWFKFVKKSAPSVFSTSLESTSQHACGTYIIAKKKERDNIGSFVPFDSTNRPLPKSRDEERDALELSSEIAREEFYEDDDPTADLFAGSDTSDVEQGEIGSHASDVTGSITLPVTSKNYIGYMTMTHTLAFCHLALMWLQEPVCLSDLIRWVTNGHFPYHDAASFFPSFMKFSKRDGHLFCGSDTPLKTNVCAITNRLMKYIDMPEIPKQDMNIHIARYSVDLQLPALLHRCVQNIAKKVNRRLLDLPNYDDLAMAFIILTLKLIYGLDGKTERELAMLAVEIPKDDQSKLYFPIWTDLMEVISTCHATTIEGGAPLSMEHVETLKDVRNYTEFCHDKVFGSWEAPAPMRGRRRQRYLRGGRGLTIEKREEYVDLFRTYLTHQDKPLSSCNFEAPLSFPFLEGKRLWLERHENEATRVDDSKNTENTESGSNLFDKMNERGIPYEAVVGYYRKEVEKDDRTFYSTYHLPKIGHRCKTKKITYTKQKLQEMWKEAVLPDSLRNLLEMCSTLIELNPLLLHTVLLELEQQLIERHGTDVTNLINNET